MTSSGADSPLRQAASTAAREFDPGFGRRKSWNQHDQHGVLNGLLEAIGSTERLYALESPFEVLNSPVEVEWWTTITDCYGVLADTQKPALEAAEFFIR